MDTAVTSGFEELLSASVNDVLATMFFAEAVPQADSSPFHDLGSLGALAEFHGDREGSLLLSLSLGCLRRLASSFLGTETEEDVTEEELGEVLCELVNMVCGSFLSRTERTGNFLIRTPTCPADSRSMPAPRISRYYEVEGGSMQVHLDWTEKT